MAASSAVVRARPAYTASGDAGALGRVPGKTRGLRLGFCIISRPVVGTRRRIIPLKLKCSPHCRSPHHFFFFFLLDASARLAR